MSTQTTSEKAKQVHILGIGNIGKLFAHSLANEPTNTHVTLLLHREGLLDDWASANRTVTLIQDDLAKTGGNITIDTTYSSNMTPISNIIVCTKAAKTAAALSSVKHRLTPASTVLFAQNGMGTVEEVTSTVFPDPTSRPMFLSSINSHGIFTNGPFSSTYAGKGFLAIGTLLSHPSPLSNLNLSTESELVTAILSTPLLNSRVVVPEEFLPLQLEKLMVNAIMNPLTSIFNIQNGALFPNTRIYALSMILLREISAVFRTLPELHGQTGIEGRFGVEALTKIVLDMAEKTAKNTSSMLQDVRAGRETEIDYINGYICMRGKEMGVDVEANQRLVDMVKGRITITPERIEEWFGEL